MNMEMKITQNECAFVNNSYSGQNLVTPLILHSCSFAKAMNVTCQQGRLRS
jgi:hypothetical protein